MAGVDDHLDLKNRNLQSLKIVGAVTFTPRQLSEGDCHDVFSANRKSAAEYKQLL